MDVVFIIDRKTVSTSMSTIDGSNDVGEPVQYLLNDNVTVAIIRVFKDDEALPYSPQSSLEKSLPLSCNPGVVVSLLLKVFQRVLLRLGK
ncbi:hypothetical protein DXD59_09715 [Olsenella sp. TM06-36]|nr:hypothetical protein DXD59_09715 [Olsenella sp. TM06-36]RHJ91940.1 hypothetical protein DW092_08690 [Olsenella sp. AM05-7]RHJ97097.1 hypothetical protein DW090_09135 [Olsenella sp. AM05-17]